MEMAAAEPERVRRIIKIIYGGKAFWARSAYLRDGCGSHFGGQPHPQNYKTKKGNDK